MKSTKLYLFVLTSILLLSANCSKEETEVNDKSDLTDFTSYIEEEIRDQNIPALAMLIFKEDETLYENYWGKSNIEQNISLQNNHLFLLASVSKVITATALLQLYEKGLFSLDDKINDYLSFNVSVPNQSEDITFKMLLTHTAAIADGSALDDEYYYGVDSPVKLAYYLKNYLSPSGAFYNATENFHNFEPGTESEYSNTGNALIGLLVEQISEIDFNEYCKQNIFTPLGMVNTFWRLDEISQTIVQPYNYENGEYESIEHYTFTDYPNGGLRSTAKDLSIFLTAFVQQGISNNHQLLKLSTINDMVTPQIPSIDDEMGLHLFLISKENNIWGHDGGEQGAATIMGFNPITKIGVIILTNQGEVELDDILIETYKYGNQL